jgi:hypothetical protein
MPASARVSDTLDRERNPKLATLSGLTSLGQGATVSVITNPKLPV